MSKPEIDLRIYIYPDQSEVQRVFDLTVERFGDKPGFRCNPKTFTITDPEGKMARLLRRDNLDVIEGLSPSQMSILFEPSMGELADIILKLNISCLDKLKLDIYFPIGKNV